MRHPLELDRRTFLAAAAGLTLWPAWRALATDAADANPNTPIDGPLVAALQGSNFVYVSPLRADGSESTCHGEVWYGWLDGAVVLITSKESWKARALGRGLDTARVWAGDHGRWKQMLGRSEAFRQAPSFEARAVAVRDDALLDRLLALYETKYPAEIANWRDKMRAGYRDGSRVLIRYAPA